MSYPDRASPDTTLLSQVLVYGELLRPPTHTTAIAERTGVPIGTVGNIIKRLLDSGAIVPCSAPSNSTSRKDARWLEPTPDGVDHINAELDGIEAMALAVVRAIRISRTD